MSAISEIEGLLRVAISDFEHSDEFPSEVARETLIRILTHTRIHEAIAEAQQASAIVANHLAQQDKGT